MKKKESSSKYPEQSSPTPEATAAPRRGALKRLAAGGAAAGLLAAMPSRWTRPVVESVMLPAHAQTSPDGESEPPPDGNFIVVAAAQEQFIGLLDWFVPTANAGAPEPVPDCGFADGCARLEDGVITLFLTFIDDEAEGIVCVTGTDANDPVDLEPVNQLDQILCSLPEVSILQLSGEAPDRILTVRIGSDDVTFGETQTLCDGCD